MYFVVAVFVIQV